MAYDFLDEEFLVVGGGHSRGIHVLRVQEEGLKMMHGYISTLMSNKMLDRIQISNIIILLPVLPCAVDHAVGSGHRRC